jgi:hypothetical protein
MRHAYCTAGRVDMHGTPARTECDVVSFAGAHAMRLANREVEVIVATDFGPRILSYALRGGRNVLGRVEPSMQARPTPFGEPWHIYGGHRLWHAPEDPVRSYVPDNDPIRATFGAGVLTLAQPAEKTTSLVKQLRIRLGAGSDVIVEHRIVNAGEQPVDLAVWALTVMATGGRAYVPNPPFAPHPEALLPARRIVTWPYTQLDDPRLRFGRKLVSIAQDPHASSPQKLGFWDARCGWAAYACDDTLFVKRFAVADASRTYADLGCNLEVFTDHAILELETLSPIERVAPSMAIEHTETWSLFGGVVVPEGDEDAHATLAERVPGNVS